MTVRLTKLILIVMVAGLVCILTSGMVLAKNSKDTIFVIGDSLSDPGNLYSLTGFWPLSPPYAQRFSNGPVWAEYVSMDRDVPFDNRAYGGAFSGVFVAGGVPVSNLNNVQYPGQFSTLLPGVAEEIDSLLADHPKGLNPKALYVIWVGPNDFFLGLNQPATMGAVLAQTAANVSEGVCRLGTAGARHFVVGNLADIGMTPFASAQGPANQAFMSQTIAQFNAGLAQVLTTLPSACAETVQVWDTYQALRDIAADPARFGLTNITDSCLTDTSICPNPDGYLFWDSVHPTTAVHAIIADQFASVVCAADDDDDEMEGDHYKKHHHDKDDDFAGCWRED